MKKLINLKFESKRFLIIFDKKLDNLYTIVQDNQQRNKRENLKNEAYSKRFNILIHGLKEQDSSLWKTRKKTEKTLHEFFHIALIKNSKNIKLANIHCMPKQPVPKMERKFNDL